MAPESGSTNYYAVLEVSPTATPDQIKQSYRRQVLKTHPDLSRNATDHARFHQVKRAYEVLSDPTERERYDMLMGLGRHSDTGRFYRRSFNRLFDNLFRGLRQTLNTTAAIGEAVDELHRRAG